MKRAKNSLEVKQRRYGYIFLIPFIIGAVLFVVLPLITAVLYSFGEVKLSPTGGGLAISKWVGMENFNQIFNVDTDFKKDILSALGDMAINVPIVVIFSFFVASVLNTKFIGRGVARSIIFLPVIVSVGVVVYLSGAGMAQSLMSSVDRFAQTGASDAATVTSSFKNMLEQMSLDKSLIDFLLGAVDRISAIVTMGAVSIIIFLAGLQGISPSIFEASYIEGATKWEVFWKISFPMVSPIILLSVIYTVVDSFTTTTNPVVSAIHDNIISSNYATASAMAVSYSLIMLVILGALYAIISRFVFYYD